MRNNRITTIALHVMTVLVLCTLPACRNNAKANGLPEGDADAERIDELGHVVIPSELSQQILEYPGFTVSFNQHTHQPNYVVWELTRDEVNTNVVGKRSNNFQPDLSVKGSATLDDYRRSGYDRGHMAPSGDMKWSKDASESSFLLTNMSPQNKDLNGGAWRVLEENCRNWARRDSAIWIVCGPIFTDQPVQTIGRSGVAVPHYYFKVILSPYANPPQGIGFIMPNRRVEGGVQPTAVSIDEVERVTGFDFFPALLDDIENEVESQCNYPRWNRRNRN